MKDGSGVLTHDDPKRLVRDVLGVFGKNYLDKTLTLTIMMDDALSVGLITYAEWSSWENFRLENVGVEREMILLIRGEA